MTASTPILAPRALRRGGAGLSALTAQAAGLGTSRWPFISRRTTERPQLARLLVRRDGSLGYPDEREEDRDTEGGLWVRITSDPTGGGRVTNALPHYYRQRHLMRELLCQVCVGAPARNRHGDFLFVLPDGPERLAGLDLEGVREATPPVCLHDADDSAAGCPRLTRCVALWVRRPLLYGVHGTRYGLGPQGLHVLGLGMAEYETPALGWVVATQMVRSLNGVTVDEELTAHLRALGQARQSRPHAPASTTA
ncbi:hypothetical protein [Streptomyces sp. C]|uniref:hypothetical protein n=1 Tax=Streptomyces sp. C TaxID=253839 RepID=UPI0001B4F27B|nr:hypothetical protein [Streptomyces sp. C]EFL19887.1 predicted protein [Streptomyces sp. C]